MSFVKKIWKSITPTKIRDAPIPQICFHELFEGILDETFDEKMIDFLNDNDDKIDVNARISFTHITPLLYTIMYYKYKIAQILLQHGANPNIMTGSQKSALTQTIHINNNMFELLIERGANINSALDHDGCILIHRAVRSFNTSRIFICIDAGADINVKNTRGDTPLHTMLNDIRNDISDDILKDVCTVLLENGANPTITNSSGQTSLDLVPENLSYLIQLMINSQVQSTTKSIEEN